MWRLGVASSVRLCRRTLCTGSGDSIAVRRALLSVSDKTKVKLIDLVDAQPLID